MSKRTAILFCVLVALLALVPQAWAQADKVDEYVQTAMRKQKIPGLSIAVVRDGEVVKAKGYGLANVELGVAATPDTIYQSGSVGKQFTATLAMMLVEEGKLGLDDPVSKYLPSAPPAWRGITLRHLLTHTSGISNSIYQRINMRQDYTEDELLQQIMAMPLDFQPGEKWNYSNAGYVTLGILIHKATGKFYGDLLREKIFAPLGMTTARVISEADIVPNRAAGYRLVDGQLKNQEWVSPLLNTTADGALYLTVLDLAKWDAALYTEKLLKRSSLDRMWTPVKLNGGKTEPYGFGWQISDVRGHHVVHHGGAWQGFTMSIARYVDDKLTVIVMTNLAGARPGRIGKVIAGLYNAELGPAAYQTVKIDPKIFDAYVGEYQLAPEVTLGISREGDRFWAKGTGQDPVELFAESETRFFFDDSETEITFERDANGKVTHLVLHQEGETEARKIR